MFSVGTLRSSLSDQPTMENNSDCSSIELGGVSEPFSSSFSCGSSKIKAALEVLQSLTKRPDSARKSCSLSVGEGSSDAQNGLNLYSGKSCENLHNDESISNGVNSNSVTVVGEKSTSNGVSSNSVAVAGEKAIVFSQWTRMLDLLEDSLKKSSIQYRRLDGTMSVIARDKAVKDFNTRPEVSFCFTC